LAGLKVILEVGRNDVIVFDSGRQSSDASMSTPITAAMLYDLVQCPHRVTMDLFADPAFRDKVSPFVQLLWDKGLPVRKRSH
jgi:hypothetical protein